MLGAKHGAGMPRFFFHMVHGNDRLDDVTGVELAGEQPAFDHAVDILQRLLRTPAGQELDSTYLLEVADAHGNYLFPVTMDLPIIQQVRGGGR
jgi:hypothetical protein